jgi:hypothetical protein
VPSYTELPNSTYLDLTSYRSNAALPNSNQLLPSFSFNVALVLERANDPTPLLTAEWASRQQQLQALNNSGTLWTTYGADQSKYNNALAYVGPGAGNLGLQTLDASNSGYVASAASRTIWVHVDQTNFSTLFGPNAVMYDGGHDAYGNPIAFWKGDLSLPDPLIAQGVVGLWFDSAALQTSIVDDHATANGVTLDQGPQSVGNGNPGSAFPNVIAQGYNFPFSPAALATAVPTGRIGLVEPGIGTALPSGSAPFDQLLNQYRRAAGISTPAPPTIDVAPGGQQEPGFDERSLDVGIVTTVNPQSQLVLYAGSGFAQGANHDAFTAYQSAIWDIGTGGNNPEVVSSSFKSFTHLAPNSPFSFALQQLFVDAVLNNITVVNAAGDGGSGDELPNGVTNTSTMHSDAYSIVAGGTSFSTFAQAGGDPTLNGTNATLPDLLAAALAGDRSTIWQLVAGGLSVLPSSADATDKFIETVWNQYSLSGNTINGYLNNQTGAGGVDPAQAEPWYQTAFGLDLHTADPAALPGRGVPDVSATSGGNGRYTVPQIDMTGTTSNAGTSAAAPLWAALASQINAVFKDQGLPRLGFMTDLLYIAAAIAPGSLNDITLGNNVSTLTLGGSYQTQPPRNSPDDANVAATPTGYGYYAGPGYDLTTGLGSPNGTVLARTLSAIGHEQVYFDSVPDVLSSSDQQAWTSGAQQNVLVQAMSGLDATFGLAVGGDSSLIQSTATAAFAWTARFAQQVLQPFFDPALVVMFDKNAQGALTDATLGSGAAVSVSIDGQQANGVTTELTGAFGFGDFQTAQGNLRIARPVAVAETAGGANDQNAVVRLRQNGEDSLSLLFYRVDDFDGTVGGKHPGDAGYAEAAQAHAYATIDGGIWIGGPGYGNFAQTELTHVNAGDLVAMELRNDTFNQSFFGFSQANEQVNGQKVAHLWNYALNTWGFEDTYGGGDRDYNDMVVGLDFTSASGHGWLK